MTWPLASFALLALALGAGFAWYERSHPSAKVLALVGTLGALAALGRIAFAPLPSVKPTTDIVLISGFALGGAPGFAVGAVAALASNLFFGQGPWTPWQMLGWGAVGVLGALLARGFGDRIGRRSLALACGVAALGFSWLQNLSLWIQFSGDHTWAKLAAIWSAAVPFDLAHVAGSIGFALAFGPALLASVRRFRARFEVRWSEAPARAAVPGAALAALAALVVGAAAFGHTAPPARAASGLQPSIAYLKHAQNADGGFGAAPHAGSAQLYTGWAALGLAAAGVNPRDVRTHGHTPLDATRAGLHGLTDTGELERTILVVAAGGLNPRRFGGRNLVAALLRKRHSSGEIGSTVNWTVFGIFALRAAGYSRGSHVIKTAGRWLARQASATGGFGFQPGGPADVDDTGSALQALAASGRAHTRTADRAVAYLKASQRSDGGFPARRGDPSNAQTTAFAVQGLIAVGRNPARFTTGGSRSPLGYLRTLIGSNGAVRYSRTSTQTPVWVTAQALAALARRPFPLAQVARARRAVARPKPAATPAVAPVAPVPHAAVKAASQHTRTAARPRAISRGRVGVSQPEVVRVPSEASVLATARTVGTMVAWLFAPVS